MNKDSLLKYGPCLSSEEYQQQVSALYNRAAAGQLPGAQGAIEQAVEEAEFNLAIDYKLGRHFPPERRRMLWEAKCKAEKQRLRLVARFLRKSIRDRAFASGMQVWTEQLTEEFSKVLSPQELNAFLGLEMGEKPVFPIDAEKL